jgi:hypothetical protein
MRWANERKSRVPFFSSRVLDRFRDDWLEGVSIDDFLEDRSIAFLC